MGAPHGFGSRGNFGICKAARGSRGAVWGRTAVSIRRMSSAWMSSSVRAGLAACRLRTLETMTSTLYESSANLGGTSHGWTRNSGIVGRLEQSRSRQRFSTSSSAVSTGAPPRPVLGKSMGTHRLQIACIFSS